MLPPVSNEGYLRMATESLELRAFTAQGLAAFRTFLESHEMGGKVPAELLSHNANTELFGEGMLDPSIVFKSRFEFGKYLVCQLAHRDFEELTSSDSDNFWAWVAAVYFDQLSAETKRSRKPKKPEHYVVTRHGHRGSLHYRQGPRTAFEMVYVHGDYAKVCLCVPMGEFGDMAEQLTSRFKIARDTGYFRAAAALYLREESLVHGAASRTRHPRKRKPRERRGQGGAGRLAKAFNWLTLTYDTAAMASEEILAVLPREFDRFKPVR